MTEEEKLRDTLRMMLDTLKEVRKSHKWTSANLDMFNSAIFLTTKVLGPYRANWNEAYKGASYLKDVDDNAQRLVTVSRHTLLIARNCIASMQLEESYHHRDYAIREIDSAIEFDNFEIRDTK